MPTNEHVTQSFGTPVEEFDPAQGIKNPKAAIRLRVEYDQAEEGLRFSDLLAKLRATPHVQSIEHLIVGSWGEPMSESCDDVIEALVAARGDLASLETLFLGDIIQEECEISWIRMSDLSPLWAAYPALVGVRIRGTEGLSLGQLQLPNLKTLIIETGGMPPNILEQALNAQTPELEHLELWLGDDGYGWDSSVEDLRPLLDGKLFPQLKRLGLRDSCVADDVAKALADAPILGRIDVLDLSLGNLSDEGAMALVKSSSFKRLKHLDIHHHYVSEEMVDALRGSVPSLNATEKQEPYVYKDEVSRFVAVSE